MGNSSRPNTASKDADSDDETWIEEDSSQESGTETEVETDEEDEAGGGKKPCARTNVVYETASGDVFAKEEWTDISKGVCQESKDVVPTNFSDYRNLKHTSGIMTRAVVAPSEDSNGVLVFVRDTAAACLEEMKMVLGEDFKAKLTEARASTPAYADKPRAKSTMKRYGETNTIYNTAFAAEIIRQHSAARKASAAKAVAQEPAAASAREPAPKAKPGKSAAVSAAAKSGAVSAANAPGSAATEGPADSARVKKRKLVHTSSSREVRQRGSIDITIRVPYDAGDSLRDILMGLLPAK